MPEPKTLLKYPEHRSKIWFPAFKTEGEKPKNPAEKFLSLFADVRAGEGISALLLGLNVFLLLTGYLLLKTARDTLILTEGGAEVKTYSSAGQAILLLMAVPFYGWIGTRVTRLKLLVILNLFFAANLVLFSAFGRAGAHIGVVFYVWVGIFNVFVISQFWAFANDIYAEGPGRRLFPMIVVGQSLGGVAGASLAALLFHNLKSPYELMLLTAILLLVSITITSVVDRREIRRGGTEAAREAAQPLGAEGGFQLLFRDRYLFWIAVLTVLLNVVNTSGEYVLDKLLLKESIVRFGEVAAKGVQGRQFIGQFKGEYLAWQNAVGLLSQLLLVSRLIRYAGVRKSLFVMPCISLASYSTMAFAPVLALVRVLKVAENSTDYSLQNTLRAALWLPTSREAKYKAKAAVDTFCMRTGDVLAAGIVYAAISTGAGLQAIASLSVALVLAWLWAASRIAKEHRKRTV
jgi:AAA family ATP:ADP antiporter